MFDLDLFLEAVVTEGELAAGVRPELVIARAGPGLMVPAWIEAGPLRRSRWTEAEEAFVVDNAGLMTDEEIAQALGRTSAAVKIRRQRFLEVPGASNHPDLLTAQAASRALGIDFHAVVRFFERGVLAGWRHGSLYLTRKVTLYRFATNPANWCYFWYTVQDTARIGDTHLRRLIKRQKERWDDTWLTTGQVAELYGVEHKDVERYILRGKIRGTKWGNWWVKRREALKPGLRFYKGKGGARGQEDWSEAVDLFILIGAGLGVPRAEIARRVGWPWRRVEYRLRIMRREGIVQDMAGKYGFEVVEGRYGLDLGVTWEKDGHRWPGVR